ncbi:MAG TPA: tRNA dihydrouridine synthase DusB [candidate division Zixibacteria bacterium]|nr:tRNA dihydrouridine synthase DusB [candidate division Zixibacteria bacterium]
MLYIVGMQIGNLNLGGAVVAAPLAGVSDRAYRRLARRGGAALVFTEMISTDGLVRDNAKTLEMIAFGPDERPIGVQLFGADPAVVEEAAARVAERFQPDLIDLNFGCPVRKVVGRNGGAAMLKDPDLAGQVMAAAVRGAKTVQGNGGQGIPVTVKMRTGWDETRPVYLDLAAVAEAAGVAAVTLHARSRSRGFAGKADWEAIARLKQAVGITVIGNGDVTTPEDARRLMRDTGCDGVMVGRAAMGDPWVFGRIERYLATGERVPEPSAAERINWMREHVAMAVQVYGEARGIRIMRKFLAQYVKGLAGAAALRPRLYRVSSLAEVEAVVGEWLGAKAG